MGRAHEVRAASMAKTAAMKSKLYAKYGKEIFMAAKSGVPDPNTNLTLRKVVEKQEKKMFLLMLSKELLIKQKVVQTKTIQKCVMKDSVLVMY